MVHDSKFTVQSSTSDIPAYNKDEIFIIEIEIGIGIAIDFEPDFDFDQDEIQPPRCRSVLTKSGALCMAPSTVNPELLTLNPKLWFHPPTSQ